MLAFLLICVSSLGWSTRLGLARLGSARFGSAWLGSARFDPTQQLSEKMGIWREFILAFINLCSSPSLP